MEIKKVGVLGCGLMGSGIAQVAATAGCDVTVLEQDQKFLDRGFAGIEKSLSRLVERGPAKGGLTSEQKTETQSRLKGTTKMQDLADCDIVIEAIIENVDEKRRTYAELDQIVKKDAIFATNTSSISVTELMTSTKRPERFIGLHFFNPVPMMKLVEVVKTIATTPDVFDSAVEFGKRLGKVPVRTSDKTGFIVNRLLVPYLLDAIRAYEEGVGSITDIDEAMKLGCGYPMGPFTLLDFVGLDTTYYITEVMYDEFKERRFASPALLRRLVLAGWYGRKSGKGFTTIPTRTTRCRGSLFRAVVSCRWSVVRLSRQIEVGDDAGTTNNSVSVGFFDFLFRSELHLSGRCVHVGSLRAQAGGVVTGSLETCSALDYRSSRKPVRVL